MATFLIHKFIYSGDNYHYESPVLGKGLRILEGDNGTGKSTFFNLIYYALSGSVSEFSSENKESHTEIVNDTNNFVLLEIHLEGAVYFIKRFIGSNDIWVTSENQETEILPINRSKEIKYVFSDWILDKLGISVVEIFQGVSTHKINFKDLLRLIYHDQQPNPKNVYKEADVTNYISDSILVRKIIFQLLIGKTYSEYYSELAKLKKAEKDKNEAKSLLDEYLSLSKRLSENNESLNEEHLIKKIEDTKSSLEKLILIREQEKIERPPVAEKNIEIIEQIRIDLMKVENEISDLSSKDHEYLGEIIKLERLKDSLILEATQIKKIIHSHDKLNLFTPDTCPYCLHKVERKEGHCVCGNDINEAEYERFFYDSSEYAEILKSKQKSVETVETAINEYTDSLSVIRTKKEQNKTLELGLKKKISLLVSQLEMNYKPSQLDEIDDKIINHKESISKLNQRLEIERTLSNYQKKFDSLNANYTNIRNKAKVLEYEAEQDIQKKIESFNIQYNELMTKTLKDCKTARIDYDSYMPIINNGEYREASSSVSRRLNYYLTFLKLSLTEKKVNFPKFLLIDTPRTAGIDEKNFNKILSQLGDMISNTSIDFQIIFSTGLGQYPKGFENYIFDKLTDENRLLKKKPA